MRINTIKMDAVEDEYDEEDDKEDESPIEVRISLGNDKFLDLIADVNVIKENIGVSTIEEVYSHICDSIKGILEPEPDSEPESFTYGPGVLSHPISREEFISILENAPRPYRVITIFFENYSIYRWGKKGSMNVYPQLSKEQTYDDFIEKMYSFDIGWSFYDIDYLLKFSTHRSDTDL